MRKVKGRNNDMTRLFIFDGIPNPFLDVKQALQEEHIEAQKETKRRIQAYDFKPFVRDDQVFVQITSTQGGALEYSLNELRATVANHRALPEVHPFKLASVVLEMYEAAIDAAEDFIATGGQAT